MGLFSPALRANSAHHRRRCPVAAPLEQGVTPGCPAAQRATGQMVLAHDFRFVMRDSSIVLDTVVLFLCFIKMVTAVGYLSWLII